MAFSDEVLTKFEENNIITIEEIGVNIFTYDVSCGSDVVIPENINGKVLRIGDTAFENKSLTSVIIPNTVFFIEGHAFLDNKITNIIIPSNVEYISPCAFQGNELSSIKFENGIKHIETFSFADNNITEVTLPETVTFYACDAFDDFVIVNKSDDLICTPIEHME